MMKRRKRLLWQIFPPIVVVTIVAVIGTTFYASKILRQFHIDQTTADLKIRTQLAMDELHDDFAAGSGKDQNLVLRCRQIAARAQARITLILLSGEVVADSVEDPVRLDNHADRKEIVAAISSGFGTSIRFSRTLNKNMLYVALPVHVDGSKSPAFGVIRLSVPLVSVETVLNKIYRRNFLGAFLLIFLAALITLYVSRKISIPLEEMGRIAERYVDLDFKKQIVFPEKRAVSQEVAGLAQAVNRMAMDLRRRIDTVTEQKSELEAVFKNMVEGVIVVDTRERIVRANDAAANLLKLPVHRLTGRPVSEGFRDADLSRFIRETLAGELRAERDFVFYQTESEQHFHAGGTLLHDGSGNKIGALIVLNDITKTKKLENMRREFVANVSHELKTPITSVKGFAETLLDGALDDKQEAGRFLEIIYRQANRLDAIVDDLLSLSRIEQEEEQGIIELQEQTLRPVLGHSIESCVVKAQEKDISLQLDCEPRIIVAMNANLLEQAVTNLLVNAIKYSPEKSEVQVNAYQVGDKVCIKVSDQGCGIAAEHLPRLFERFYRSDKARSRKLGGTGLGLAIVKHIVQAHGGEVSVKSAPGKGSTFSIILSQTSTKV
jgi:two-component system phosphate regulon sensor histidine kinase PhoR